MKTPLIAAYLMSEKGWVVLKTLVLNHLSYLIAHVTVGTDKNIVKDFSCEIIQLCKEYNISWSYRRDSAVINAEYSIAVSWRWMLPVKNKLIIFHDSLLPRYRGFAPLVNQLIQGEKEIGVTVLFGSDEYDRGDIIAQEKIEITYPITISEAICKSLLLYKQLALKVAIKIKKGESLIGFPQNDNDATYSLWRDSQDYRIDWSKDAAWIERFVDATGSPYLGAKAKLNGMEILVNKVKTMPDVTIHNRDIGKVIFMYEGKPVIVCGMGLLTIIEALFVKSSESAIPLLKFRSRFT